MKEPKLPTLKELKAIPEKNFMSWLSAEYGNECSDISYFLIGDEADNGFLEFKTYCSGLNQTFCDVSPEEYEKIKEGYYNDKLFIRKIRASYESIPNYIGYGNEDEIVHFKDRNTDTWLTGTWNWRTYEFECEGKSYKPIYDVIEWRYDRNFNFIDDEDEEEI